MDIQYDFDPDQAFQKIKEAILLRDLPPDGILQLVITIEEANINVRELASYFNFIDKIYGRLTPSGLASYAQKPKEQLELSSVRKDSIELIISEVLSNIDKASPLIVILLALKYLPEFLRAYGETAKNLAESGLRKKQTEMLAMEIKEQEENLAEVDEETLHLLILLLAALYHREARSLPAVHRFSEKHVKEIHFQINQEVNIDG